MPDLMLTKTASFCSSLCLYESAQAAITKYHRMGGLNNINLFSHSSGVWKSEIKVPGWSGCGENAGLLSVVLFGERGSALPSSSYKGTSSTGLRLHPYDFT